MCDICNGESIGAQLRRMRSLIDEHGFTKMAVSGPVPWMYTIGLAERGHPELLIACLSTPEAYGILENVGRRVLAGESLAAGTTVIDEGRAFDLVTVHPSRLRAGLCAAWELGGATGRERSSLRVLQLRVPDDWFCRCHAQAQPRLDLPGGVPGMSRDARRRDARARRRTKRPRRR